jgi:hypothetical protein
LAPPLAPPSQCVLAPRGRRWLWRGLCLAVSTPLPTPAPSGTEGLLDPPPSTDRSAPTFCGLTLAGNCIFIIIIFFFNFFFYICVSCPT